MKTVRVGDTLYEDHGTGQLVAVGQAESNGPRPPGRRLGALSRAAALERIAATPAEWLIQDVLSSVDYGVLAGPKGVGKSLAMCDASVSVGLGEPWLGRFTTTAAPVLLLTCEDHEGRIWNRLDAIARSKGHEPTELEGRVHVHPLPFSAIKDLELLEAELDELRPSLVVLDPAYKYLGGVNARALFEMGEALTPLQAACWRHGAALLVGHHYNRREGVTREERVAGAGLLEWARVIVTIEADARRAGDGDDVTVSIEISGNSLDPIAVRFRRTVWPMQEGPNPELGYSVAVVAEGAEARPGAHPPTAERIRQVLGHEPGDGLTVAEISEAIGPVIAGKHLKHDTIRKALSRLEGDVDNDQALGSARRWWLVEGVTRLPGLGGTDGV